MQTNAISSGFRDLGLGFLGFRIREIMVGTRMFIDEGLQYQAHTESTNPIQTGVFLKPE